VDLTAMGGSGLGQVFLSMGLALALGGVCLGFAAIALTRVERRARSAATLSLT
jgi:hypothetical protein